MNNKGLLSAIGFIIISISIVLMYNHYKSTKDREKFMSDSLYQVQLREAKVQETLDSVAKANTKEAIRQRKIKKIENKLNELAPNITIDLGDSEYRLMVYRDETLIFDESLDGYLFDDKKDHLHIWRGHGNSYNDELERDYGILEIIMTHDNMEKFVELIQEYAVLYDIVERPTLGEFVEFQGGGLIYVNT